MQHQLISTFEAMESASSINHPSLHFRDRRHFIPSLESLSRSGGRWLPFTIKNPSKGVGFSAAALQTMLSLVFLAATTRAQTIPIGQQAPDWKTSAVLNYKNTTLSFFDFKGKHMVLDFWNHSCLSCVKAFPHIDSMQKQFAGQLQIILVNMESKDSTIRFFKKHPKIKMPAVPLVTNGNDLWTLFTNSKIPFQLWLDENRTVVYRTGPYNLTAEHLRAFLKGEKMKLLNTAENRSEDTGEDDAAGYSSSLTHCSTGINPGNTSGNVVDDQGMITLSSNCASVLDLYLEAYSEHGKYEFNTPAQIVLDVADKFKYVLPADVNEWDDWKTKYSYSYRLRIPADRKDLRYKYMQQDLQRCFGLKVKIEKRKLPCLVLTKTGTLESLGSKETMKRSTLIGRKYENDSVRYVQNYPFKDFAEILKGMLEYNCRLPFIDKTACTFNIDLRIRSSAIDPFDLSALRKELNKYNLNIITSQEWVDVLVLKQ